MPEQVDPNAKLHPQCVCGVCLRLCLGILTLCNVGTKCPVQRCGSMTRVYYQKEL